MMRSRPSKPQFGRQSSPIFSNWGLPQDASLQGGRGPNHHGHGMIDSQHGYPTDPNTRFRQHQGQEDPYVDDESRLPRKNSAIDDQPSGYMGSRHRLLQTTPPPDGVEWTRKAANAHGIDPEVMRIIIWNMSADEFEDILAYYRGGRAYRATHRILAVYIRYHMKVPTAQEFSMVTKADAPFEEFALNTSPSGLFWTDWQNSHTLNEWRLVALAIFLKLGEEKAAHRTKESKSDRKHAPNAIDERNGELSDDKLGDSSHPVVPHGWTARGSATDPKCATIETASGHLSSGELRARGEKKEQAYSVPHYNDTVPHYNDTVPHYNDTVPHYNDSGQFSWPAGDQDDWGFHDDDDDFF